MGSWYEVNESATARAEKSLGVRVRADEAHVRIIWTMTGQNHDAFFAELLILSALLLK